MICFQHQINDEDDGGGADGDNDIQKLRQLYRLLIIYNYSKN